jgi:hypothetical protein
MKPFITWLTLTYGRVNHLEEAIGCWLEQDYDGPREMLIVNSFTPQVLHGDFPNVRIVNLPVRPPNIGALRNTAIQHAQDGIILMVDDEDLVLPHHTSNYVKHFDEKTQWVWPEKAFFMLGYQIKGITTANPKVAAFTKRAWEYLGGFPNRNCGCERDFITKLITIPGKRVELAPKEVSHIRHWGNGNFKASGLGEDRPGFPTAHDRISIHTHNLAASGSIPIGDVELQPETLHDYREMAHHFLDHPEAYQPELNHFKRIGVGEVPAYTADVEKLKPWPSVTVVYINVPGDNEHIEFANRFVSSYVACPPGLPHETMIVCNGIGPGEAARKVYQCLPKCKVIQHDDTGWDIGGFIAASHQCNTDIMVCFGGQGYFKRGGWLIRMVEAWKEHGPGMYGSLASYEVSPHLNTTGFWLPPRLLMEYPWPVASRETRYDFEHGPKALWKLTAKQGLPVFLVTWTGIYNWTRWREPRNGFRAGSQEDCLTYFKHTHIYDNMLEPLMRFGMRQNSDTITDLEFIKARRRKDIALESIGASREHFRQTHKGEDLREAAVNQSHPVTR